MDGQTSVVKQKDPATKSAAGPTAESQSIVERVNDPPGLSTFFAGVANSHGSAFLNPRDQPMTLCQLLLWSVPLRHNARACTYHLRRLKNGCGGTELAARLSLNRNRKDTRKEERLSVSETPVSVSALRRTCTIPPTTSELPALSPRKALPQEPKRALSVSVQMFTVRPQRNSFHLRNPS